MESQTDGTAENYIQFVPIRHTSHARGIIKYSSWITALFYAKLTFPYVFSLYVHLLQFELVDPFL